MWKSTEFGLPMRDATQDEENPTLAPHLQNRVGLDSLMPGKFNTGIPEFMPESIDKQFELISQQLSEQEMQMHGGTYYPAAAHVGWVERERSPTTPTKSVISTSIQNAKQYVERLHAQWRSESSVPVEEEKQFDEQKFIDAFKVVKAECQNDNPDLKVVNHFVQHCQDYLKVTRSSCAQSMKQSLEKVTDVQLSNFLLKRMQPYVAQLDLRLNQASLMAQKIYGMSEVLGQNRESLNPLGMILCAMEMIVKDSVVTCRLG